MYHLYVYEYVYPHQGIIHAHQDDSFTKIKLKLLAGIDIFCTNRSPFDSANETTSSRFLTPHDGFLDFNEASKFKLDSTAVPFSL